MTAESLVKSITGINLYQKELLWQLVPTLKEGVLKLEEKVKRLELEEIMQHR
eukprot:CAMPEP_0176346284 /NCGR_PEP_ID=MMETSP0126-20121128/6122_1 /TAXON_ID=141414 ORGANISM="Strombidinopsis acuminatum, Strain SPMC142" /NCGR_SAMPLE_ID=MMETSP0126 /ASSEMBLY_ACC=CAM_ASM_000229 /LENGTH=51 /DNA_ID=CAMNT_0017693743 /DNA_START=971 /DNA_END=1126 /DNA_ORIENTATION=+